MACCYRQSRVCGSMALSGLYLDVGSIPASNTILQGSTCYYFDLADPKSLLCHGTLHAGYSTVTDCSDASCTPAAPCTCPGGVAASYAISGYADGNLTACVTCANDANPAWNGTFTKQAGVCEWWAPTTKRINGKTLDVPTAGSPPNRPSYIYLNPSVVLGCYWELEIGCPGNNIWGGRKFTGGTPAGVYSRVQGCDTTATLTLA